MIIKTRKLPATTTAPTRMRATVSESASGVFDGATLTLPYPHNAFEDPDMAVALSMASAIGYSLPDEFTRTGQHTWEYE